jgi:hypothetical protein
MLFNVYKLFFQRIMVSVSFVFDCSFILVNSPVVESKPKCPKCPNNLSFFTTLLFNLKKRES